MILRVTSIVAFVEAAQAIVTTADLMNQSFIIELGFNC
jgi:hypothetical protein